MGFLPEIFNYSHPTEDGGHVDCIYTGEEEGQPQKHATDSNVQTLMSFYCRASTPAEQEAFWNGQDGEIVVIESGTLMRYRRKGEAVTGEQFSGQQKPNP